MLHKLILVAAILFIPVAASPQNLLPTDRTEQDEKLEQAAVEMLRETQAETEGLRLVENRISFASELASLMWFHDEREARSMYAGVINDFRQLLMSYDVLMNQYGVRPPDEPEQYGPFFFGDATERQKAERKFRIAVSVRQSIASSMAEHDPELALTFYYDSLYAVSNADLRKQMESGDKYFEQQLLEQIASLDPLKAAQLAKRSLEKSFNQQQVDVLKKLYDKDVDKAVELAASMLARVKSEKPESLELAAASSLLKFGTQLFDRSRTTGGQKPIYFDGELRDLAEALSQAVLARSADSGIPFANYARDVERFQPGRALQIRAKAPARSPNRNAPTRAQVLRAAANTSMTGPPVSSGPNANSAAAAARAQREQNEKKMFDDVMKIGAAKLTAEQRNKIVQQARATIMSMQSRDKKVTGLSVLAAQVAKAGDSELAAELMRDAASMVNPQPRNFQDFMLTWMLATGYASVDPEKAFPILEETLNRANDLIAALIKLGEFIDVNEEIIADGELQVGSFGGSMVRGVTKELGMADSTIELLSKADFEKMKSLTNRFDRPEIRVLAKMMVLRAVLGSRQQATKTKSVAKPG